MGVSSIDPNAKIDHVHLKVSDLERSVKFYESFLRLKIIKKTPEMILFSSDGNTQSLLSISESSSKKHQGKMAGLYHFAILLPKREDLGNFLSYLLKHKEDVKIDGFSDHLVSEAIYIRDPDNIGIEIYRDRPQSEWNWENSTVQMAVNPLDMKGLIAESTIPWNKFPTKTSIGHVHLHVSDLDKSKNFYSDILGFNRTASMKGALFFAAGKYHHHIATNTWLGEDISKASEDFPGLGYFSIKFSNKEKLNQVLRQLTSNKIPFEELDSPNLFRVFDKDQISIHLTC